MTRVWGGMNCVSFYVPARKPRTCFRDRQISKYGKISPWRLPAITRKTFQRETVPVTRRNTIQWAAFATAPVINATLWRTFYKRKLQLVACRGVRVSFSFFFSLFVCRRLLAALSSRRSARSWSLPRGHPRRIMQDAGKHDHP